MDHYALEAKHWQERTWAAVTLGGLSRAIHTVSLSYLLKRHILVWEFLPRKIHLNSKHCINFINSIKPIQ